MLEALPNERFGIYTLTTQTPKKAPIMLAFVPILPWREEQFSKVRGWSIIEQSIYVTLVILKGHMKLRKSSCWVIWVV